MKILFDNGVPNPLAGSLTGHLVAFSRQIRRHELKNGELIQQAEEAGYELLLTTDKNMRYQQELAGRRIAVVVLGQQQWPIVKRHLARIAAAVNAATPGSLSKWKSLSSKALAVSLPGARRRLD